MRPAVLLTTLVGAAAVWAAPAQASPLDTTGFRYTRSVEGAGERPVRFEPDGQLFAHARPGFVDLRFTDARGREIPWRFDPDEEALVRRPRSIERSDRRRVTEVEIDLGHRGLPVDTLKIGALTRRYDRDVRVLGSDRGRRWRILGGGRLYDHGRDGDPRKVRLSSIPIDSRYRLLRLRIENRDDPPLGRITVVAESRSRGIVVEGGHPIPYRAWYGDEQAELPSYDFARIGPPPTSAPRIVAGGLGAEIRNSRFEPPPPPPDRRSFTARHPELLTVALVLAALAVAVAGAVALRGPRVSR